MSKQKPMSTLVEDYELRDCSDSLKERLDSMITGTVEDWAADHKDPSAVLINRFTDYLLARFDPDQFASVVGEWLDTKTGLIHEVTSDERVNEVEEREEELKAALKAAPRCHCGYPLEKELGSDDFLCVRCRTVFRVHSNER
jgi:hypothetical protein